MAPAAVGAALVLGVGWVVAGSGDATTAIATTGTSAAREGVVVTGAGEVSGRPDVLRLDLGVEAVAPGVDAALEQANQALARMRDALRERGVGADELQTSGLSIQPRYDGEGRTITAYATSETLTARLRDLDAAGATITATVRAGGDAARVQGVSFDLEDDADLLDQARVAAMADARTKAQTYAQAGGRDLGRVVRVSESVSAPPVPFGREALAADVAAVPVPLEPGRAQVSVTVTVEYAFR